jgi:dolichol-phosphate mannosyltransferase
VHLRDFVSTPLPVVGAMLIIVGVQFILFGLMAEVLMRTYFEAQRRKPYSVKEMISTTK